MKTIPLLIFFFAVFCFPGAAQEAQTAAASCPEIKFKLPAVYLNPRKPGSLSVTVNGKYDNTLKYVWGLSTGWKILSSCKKYFNR